VRLEGLGKLGKERKEKKRKIHLIGTRTRDLPAWSIVPQPTTLPRAPENVMKQCIIPKREFPVRIYVILNTNGKGQINIDNRKRGSGFTSLIGKD
jgi:hypothetical protein